MISKLVSEHKSALVPGEPQFNMCDNAVEVSRQLKTFKLLGLRRLSHFSLIGRCRNDCETKVRQCPGGALGFFLGGYVPPGTPNWHPVLKIICPKIDTPF